MNELKKHIETLIKKAAEATDPDTAMRFSQAALNVANAALAHSTMPGNS